MEISVTKVAQSFVRPREPTPSESLSLSTFDLFESRDNSIQSLHLFKRGHRSAKVIKEALSKALVLYYPLAGRFIDSDHSEVMAIECNGEGVWFVEAIANCTLQDVLYLDTVPSMISENDLLPDPCPESERRNVPIMMQVTEFRCGGFVVGFTFLHIVVDGIGAAQFMKAIGDFARGNIAPTVNPIWSRHLIPNPPKYPLGPQSKQLLTLNLHSSSFHLPIEYIDKIKSAYYRKKDHYCTTFEIATATIWQVRIRSIKIDNPKTHVHLCFFANIRHLLTPKILPQEGGYYGNCLHPVFITMMSGNIVTGDLVDIIMMIQDGKERLPREFDKWLKGESNVDPRNLPISDTVIYVTDWSNLGFSEVDFGWGQPTNVTNLMYGFDIAVLEKPLVPKRGCRLSLRCVTEVHMLAFQEHMKGLV